MSGEDRSSSGSAAGERWLWPTMVLLISVAAVVYMALDRADLYRMNFEWWRAIVDLAFG